MNVTTFSFCLTIIRSPFQKIHDNFMFKRVYELAKIPIQHIDCVKE